MAKVTQQNAANAEESASASEEMNAHAEQMKGIVGGLVSIVGGNMNGLNGQHKTMDTKNERITHNIARRFHAPIETEKMDISAHNRKAAPPEHVIPMDEEDFKDF